jgi:hypothetical protein
VVVNDRESLVGQRRNIALSGPAVHRDQKFRIAVRPPHMLQGDAQLLDHQKQIVFRDFPPAAVYQPGRLPLALQVFQQRIAAGDGVRIRVVMALDYNIFIAQ